MHPNNLTVIWSMLAATSFILGFMHAYLWVRRGDRTLLFATMMALFSGWLALTELNLMHTTEVARYIALLRQTHLPIAGVLISMVWYVRLRLDSGRRWLAWTITVAWLFCLVANFLSPSSLVFREIESLRQLPTFWGEEFTQAVGSANPLKLVAEGTSLLIMVFVIDAALGAWRAGRRRGAVVIGGSITFFIVVAGIYTPLVDAGIARTPSIISIAFLAIILALSWEITRDAARVEEVSRELEMTRGEMDRLLRANLLGEFASAIAHELNQPLTAVLANAQVARRYLAAHPPRVDDSREMLDLIVRDDKRAAEVIQRLHGMVARGKVVRESLDLNEVLRDTLELCDRTIRDRGILLDLDLEAGLPMAQMGRVEIQQVFLNLIHNALQALATVKPGHRRLRLVTRSLENRIRTTVEDTGPGLPTTAAESLFSPFNGHSPNGIGMGLTICRRIVEAHGGSIRAEMIARGGTRFVVELPQNPPDGQDLHG